MDQIRASGRRAYANDNLYMVTNGNNKPVISVVEAASEMVTDF